MIDAHLHLQDPRLRSTIPEILGISRQIGVQYLVVNGTHPEDWSVVENLALQYSEIIPCYGLHPWWANTVSDESWLPDLSRLLSSNPHAGVGEIGLDRGSRGRRVDWGKQRAVFSAQIELANQLDRPVSIHCVAAWGTLLEFLQTVRLVRPPLLHSYGGPAEMIDDFLRLGAFFSLSGAFFRPEKCERLAVFDQIPDSRILIETDAPDMLPPSELIRFQSEMASVNHPGNLEAIYEAVSQRRECDLETLKSQIRDNFARWHFQNR